MSIENEELNGEMPIENSQEPIEQESEIKVDRNGYVDPYSIPEIELVKEEEVEDTIQDENIDEEPTNDEQSTEEVHSEEEVEDESGVEFFTQLSDEVGLPITDEEVLIATLKEAKEIIEKSKGDAFADIPKELQLAIEVAKSGGDYKQALNVLAMDFNKMEQKEVLRQKFYQDNASLVQKDKEFADMKFEKEYESKYGVLDKTFDDDYEKEEFYNANKRDIDFAKKSLERDVADTKEALTEWQSKYVQDIKPNEVSETERQAILEKHTQNVERVLGEFEGTYLSIDDNPDNDFLVGLTDETRENLKEVLNDPRPFLSEVIGINYDTGEIDYEKLALATNVLLNIDNIGSALRQYSIEKKNKDTVESMLTNAKSKPSIDQARQPIEDEGIAIGRAIRQQIYRR